MRARTRVALLVGVAGVSIASTALALSALNSPATASEVAERGDQFLVEPAPSTARYRVSFVVEWGRSTHPATLPPNSHTSPPVVVTHGEVGDLFAPATPASAGIEIMAEVGATSTLRTELGGDPTVADVQTGRRIDGPGVDTFEFTVSQDAALVSLVSMLAPSPDWFVGVHDVELFADGRWVGDRNLTLGAYDAGTDSGSDFTSSNSNTSPAEPISGPRDDAFVAAAAEAPFGRVVIERLG